MTKPKHTGVDLLQLDRRDDPRGGAVAWALFAVGVTLITSILLIVTWMVRL
ncbi:MAG: hypothetical protein ACRDS0_04215 [Pseudonocardiaceae bacterium]